MRIAKKLIGIMMTGALVLGLAACGGANESVVSSGAQEDNTKSGGTELSGTVSTNGSTSMEKVVGILSEQFMDDNPGVTITYDATGSGTGIEAVSNGACDIGLSSRSLKSEESKKGLKEDTVALDGIAIIVNENNPLTDISLDEIAAIFRGEKTVWDAFGGTGEIACIGREAGSGTRDGFESITGTKDVCVLTQELTSTGAVIEAVKSSVNAIGYASFASVEGKEGIKVLTVGGVECNEDNISNGSYEIQRPFNLIVKDESSLSPAAKAFYEYMLSKEAYELIREAGAVPVA